MNKLTIVLVSLYVSLYVSLFECVEATHSQALGNNKNKPNVQYTPQLSQYSPTPNRYAPTPNRYPPPTSNWNPPTQNQNQYVQIPNPTQSQYTQPQQQNTNQYIQNVQVTFTPRAPVPFSQNNPMSICVERNNFCHMVTTGTLLGYEYDEDTRENKPVYMNRCEGYCPNNAQFNSQIRRSVVIDMRRFR
jgi:hypothetical protein